MAVYKTFAVTVVGELLNVDKFTHEFIFLNPKNVHMSKTSGFDTTESGNECHFKSNGHGTFDLQVET